MSTIKKTLAGIAGAGVLTASGGVVYDATVFDVQPLPNQKIPVADEIVDVKQVENTVRVDFPWKDQKGITVTYDLGTPSLSERLADKRKKNVVTTTTDFGEGGFKVDILLNEKPDTNVFCYYIEGWEDYNFSYQGPLTAEEIAEGAERPEDIVGSFAVYHKTLKNHRIGGENYATGKFGHIPYPYVWEVNNKEATKERAEDFTFSKGNLCVTARQEFLDKATYPVQIDPTFGYTTAGASSFGTANIIWHTGYDAPEAGTVTKLTAYLAWTSVFSSVHTYKTAIWDSTTRAEITNGETGTWTSPASSGSGWQDFTFVTDPTVSATTYLLGVASNQASGNEQAQFDDVGSVDDASTGITFPTFTNVDADEFDHHVSIYATYTPTGGSGGDATADPIGNRGVFDE